MQLKIDKRYQAESILNNPVWIDVWDKVNKYINDKELNCDTTDKELTSDLIRCKQLLNELQSQFKHIISEGKAAEIKLKSLEKKPKESIFKR